MPQLSQSGRLVTLVGVSEGNVYTLNPGDTTWGTPTNNTGDTPPLVFTGILQSAPNVEKLWFADGNNWVYFDPRTDSVERWSASAGDLPVDSENNTPRLIETWRGRTVLSGLPLDPQNWFCSRVNDPRDFDFAPDDPDPAQAVAGNNAPQGLVGDVVTGLCSYSDDLLIMFCDSSIFFFSGDPMAGGQIDRVSDAIGGAYGKAFCKDPYGTVWFVSNKSGIYTLRPGELPVRISQPVERLLEDIDTGATVILAQWDDKHQGVHFFFTNAELPTPTTHLFYEWRVGAWWKEVFANDQHNPVCVCTFDGNLADDRVMLMGDWDGYVRAFDDAADTDDGTPIDWEVLMGPIVTKNLDELMVKELQAVLGEESEPAAFSILTGRTAEAALSSAPVTTGVWRAGRNKVEPVRRAAHGLFTKMSGRERMMFEQLRALVGPRGTVRGRGY